MVVLKYLRMFVFMMRLHMGQHAIRYLLGVGMIALLMAGALLFMPPFSFPRATGNDTSSLPSITIAPGSSVTKVSYQLRNAHFINSTLLFRVVMRLMPGTHTVLAGTYAFERPAGILEVVWNLSHGISGLPTTRLVFPEGTTVRQMGDALARALTGFNGERFKSLALPDEGFLFPDTYFFLPDSTPEAVIALLKANFTTHEKDLDEQARVFGKSTRDVVIMASLLEAEGKTLTDRRVIAGILWKRMSIGMPLQVDASFGYDYGKTGYVPTAADLAGNSAYNTYRYRGLPPTPINNPGAESILASLTPTKTLFLYYLTGTDGEMHYAKTLPEHKANRLKYLK